MSLKTRPDFAALDGFFAHRRALASPINRHTRLSAFFERSRELGSEVKNIRAVSNNLRSRPDLPRLSELLSRIGALLSDRRGRFRYNPWEMSGLGRYEVRNSAVLGQLFDRSISPIAGPRFLARYFELVSMANGGAPLPSLEALGDYRIGVEHCPLGQQSERVDLTVEGDGFVVGIEIKIDAGEGPEQLERYLRVIEERAAFRNASCHPVIFLSPRPSGRAGFVLESSWRHVGRAAHDISLNLQVEAPRAAWLLACFAEHVRKFY